MSDLAAAAAAMGLPEALVERSAQARSAETGQSVDELYSAWAGGEAASPPDGGADAVSDETAAPEPDEPKADEAEAESEPEAPVVVVEAPGAPSEPAQPAPAGPYKPPVLVGAKDNPMTVVFAALGLFFIVVMVGLVGPSITFDSPGARTSDLPYSATALDGQDIYTNVGCVACHTQMVRPIVADVGLGAVTLNDTNQILGTRRFGPDLSDVGARISASQLEAIVAGLGDHPAHSLSADDMNALVAYLSESVTLEQGAG